MLYLKAQIVLLIANKSQETDKRKGHKEIVGSASVD
jgi:hypothetical protein